VVRIGIKLSRDVVGGVQVAPAICQLKFHLSLMCPMWGQVLLQVRN
jgi:hypothetical protein